ncbi:MAG: histidine phosphatase family protein [Bryobacteraceae bacterium]|nr:histidine phosphatase family protein [Bryobacteraceae bacterium]MDW8379341.1 histidine phosphatase family protein [Bryobacterales bacterium]
MPDLYLVRHAEPARKGVLLGRLDPPLSELGVRSAARQMPRLQAAIAYVSPLRRAQETAAFLTANIPRVTLAELTEIDLGDWEGLSWDEVEHHWPQLARRKLERWFETPAPGGESWQEVLSRAQSALEIVRQGPRPAILLAHLGILSAVVHLLTGLNPESHVQDYCQILELNL